MEACMFRRERWIRIGDRLVAATRFDAVVATN